MALGELGSQPRENNIVFGRLDAMVDYTDPMWKDSFKFVEPNLSGVGGLQLGRWRTRS